MSDLPPSLIPSPNIPIQKQTLEELIAERQYWDGQIKKATRWGAALSVSSEFRDECDNELLRRSL